MLMSIPEFLQRGQYSAPQGDYSNIGESLKTIGNFLNYLVHPGLIIQALWHCAVTYSFLICLVIAMLAIIFYGLGFKKCAKYIPGSIAVYTLIKMLASVF